MIHPTAVIEGEVEIGPDVEIGPYCHLQGKIKIGARTRLEGHVSLGSRFSRVIVGEDNSFSSGAVIGGPPQDLTYKNEVTSLRIGNRNIFREFSTVNIATTKGDGETFIGDDNYLMAYVHVGHDCKLGNRVVIANDSHLGGHTVLEDHVVVGG
ncbi:MAG: acyl-ACP--UDP-N-acetylglucosamine O-acyltransferase, partial [Bdellovibrio sp.]